MARSLWTGTISFGLVSVPVRMFSATESKELRFHFLDKRDLAPIGYDKVRRDTGEHVDSDEIVRGFEVEKGRYVPLERRGSRPPRRRADQDDRHLRLRRPRRDRPDLLPQGLLPLPQEGAEKPYRLLVRALEETGKVGDRQGRDPQQAAPRALRPWNGTLLLETMYYADEVRQPESRATASARLRNARGRDGEVARREPERRVRSRRSTTTPTARSCSSCCARRPRASRCRSRSPRRSGEVVDLMAALRESVERTQKRDRSARRREAQTRKAT